MEYDFFSFEKSPILNYSPLEKRSVFVGCHIKSKYDEDRICINESFNPKRIRHSNKNLYGVFLQPLKEHFDLMDIFEKYESMDLFFYNKNLNKFNLTCEDNFLYLDLGVYPVDSKHILKYYKKFSYNHFFYENEHLPNYQRIKSVNMMFLSPN